jgi:hypothetical protein
MATKTDFTAEEWGRLLASPMVAGMAITAADPSGVWGLLKEKQERKAASWDSEALRSAMPRRQRWRRFSRPCGAAGPPAPERRAPWKSSGRLSSGSSPA